MNNKISKFLIILFIIIIFGFGILNLIVKDKEYSVSERRKLSKMPEISISTIMNSSFFQNFEKYSLDQFVGRENFRKIKAVFELNVFNKSDFNDIVVINNSIYKKEYPLNEKSVQNATDKINYIKNKYLSNSSNIYYSIIPDKNYYLEDSKILKMDYSKLINIMNKNLKEIEYIDITNTLDSNSYYSTDLHWKQEKIQNTAKLILEKINNKQIIMPEYIENKVANFNGVYSGQAALDVASDTITILENSTTKNCKVYNYETDKITDIYDFEKFEKSDDAYDLYVSGPAALQEITNNDANTDAELIIFRDSFASSLVPLMIHEYSKITLVDIRYISSEILDEYIDFNNKDVLFIYSTTLLNNSSILK